MNSNIPDVALSAPEKCTTWSLPTPPPSLSELSTLAAVQDIPPDLARASSPSQSQSRPQRPSFSHAEGFQEPQARAQTRRGTLLPTVQPANSASLNSKTSLNWPWFNFISAMRGTLGFVRGRFAVAAFSASTAGPALPTSFAWLQWPRLTGVGAWLALYLVCNLALTLHNKRLLGTFPFPWTLTAIHAFSAALGSWICAWRGVFRPVPLNHPTTPLLALFSVLYSANIAASNASLRLVSIATHQVVRAATPLFVVLFTWISQFGLVSGQKLRRKSVGCLGISSAKLKSLTPVVLGVVFATYGDYTYTRAGLALTLLGTALAALKTMLASKVVRAPAQTSPTSAPPLSLSRPSHLSHSSRHQHSRTGSTHVRRTSMKRFEDIRVDEGYLSGDERSLNSYPSTIEHPTSGTGDNALHPLDVLFRLSPLACIQCLFVAWISGEMGQWSTLWSTQTGMWTWTWGGMAPMLALNGALAFVLNYVSFVASRRAGALSMTVAANVKQVLTVLLALLVFESGTPSVAHVLGIALTLAGGIWYGRVEAQERREWKEHGLGRRERGKSFGGQEKLGV